MNLLKHSKVRNTAILFELLVRQIAADTMENRDSPAIALLRKHFKEGTELYKELSLYRTLAEERFDGSQATRFLSAAVQSRKQLNETMLRRSKYNLIRDIKNKLVFENFINARISNYKLNASIFKVFEYNATDAPAEITRCNSTIIEHVVRKEAGPVPVAESFTKGKSPFEYKIFSNHDIIKHDFFLRKKIKSFLFLLLFKIFMESRILYKIS